MMIQPQRKFFETFSNDIITSIEVATTEVEVLVIIANRFKYWTELFKRSERTYDEKNGFKVFLWRIMVS